MLLSLANNFNCMQPQRCLLSPRNGKLKARWLYDEDSLWEQFTKRAKKWMRLTFSVLIYSTYVYVLECECVWVGVCVCIYLFLRMLFLCTFVSFHVAPFILLDFLSHLLLFVLCVLFVCVSRQEPKCQLGSIWVYSSLCHKMYMPHTYCSCLSAACVCLCVCWVWFGLVSVSCALQRHSSN